jgi:hypothetical protein
VDPPALITNRAKRLRGRQNGEFGRPPLNMRYRLRATGTRDSAGAIRGSRQGRWDRAQAVERVRVPGRQHHRLRRQPARRLGARRRAEGGRSNAQRDPGTQLHLRCGETCERCSSLIGHSTPIRCPKRLERPQKCGHRADIGAALDSAQMQRFRHGWRRSVSRLKIVVSRVRVRVSPSDRSRDGDHRIPPLDGGQPLSHRCHERLDLRGGRAPERAAGELLRLAVDELAHPRAHGSDP